MIGNLLRMPAHTRCGLPVTGEADQAAWLVLTVGNMQIHDLVYILKDDRFI